MRRRPGRTGDTLGAITTSIATTLDACLPGLQVVAAKKGWATTTEPDFQRVLEQTSGNGSTGVRLAHWPSVGAVDVMLAGRVGVELKWCTSGDTLANCAWDVAKLGCAIVEEQVSAGFIAAGAPASHWAHGDGGTELFEDGVYENDDLVRRYERWWRHWCSDVMTRPIDVPRSIRVERDSAIPVELDGEPFVLRSSRVEVLDPEWRPHTCPHRWLGERCRARPWDLDGLGAQPN